ncbi:MAG: TlpA family protein disulfide reductase [Sphingobacteriaceae bacterium]|nr:TlpA family protein disulfide reductase [Sphingobacteriaceae bacterium]
MIINIKRKYFLFVCVFTILFTHASAQESNNGKQLWANSFLNQKAPSLLVEQWISEAPDTKNKFVLIDFWATWCGPCRAYIPTLNHFSEKYKDKLVVIGLSDESIEKVKGFSNPKINYYEAIDRSAILKSFLGVKGIPHLILIDPKGIIRWEGFPGLQNHEFTESVLLGLFEKYKN